MKITLETPSKMVLKDQGYTRFIFGLVLFVGGVGASGVVILFALIFWLNAGILGLINPAFLIGIGIGAIFALAGLALIAGTKVATITLDKATGKGNISLRGILGSESKDLELRKVKKLVLRKNIIRAGRRTGYGYVIAFVMDTGEEVTFNLATGFANMDEKEKKDAQRVADFLAVRMELVWPAQASNIASFV